MLLIEYGIERMLADAVPKAVDISHLGHCRKDGKASLLKTRVANPGSGLAEPAIRTVWMVPPLANGRGTSLAMLDMRQSAEGF